MTNEQILQFLAVNSLVEYEEAVPITVRERMEEIGASLSTKPETANEYLREIINKIAYTKVEGVIFENKFKPFRREGLVYGDHIEDIFIPILRGYDPKAANNNPFEKQEQKAKVTYHKLNYEMQYMTTISDAELARGVFNEGGLQQIIEKIVSNMYITAEYDEYQTFKKLLDMDIYGAEITIAKNADNVVQCNNILSTLKEIVGSFTDMSNKYNRLHELNTSNLNNVYIILRRDIRNSIDIDYLAGVFNLSKVELPCKIIEINSFIDANQIAAIVDSSGVLMHMRNKGTRSIYQPKGRPYTNLYTDIEGYLAYSLYKNCVKLKLGDSANAVEVVNGTRNRAKRIPMPEVE